MDACGIYKFCISNYENVFYISIDLFCISCDFLNKILKILDVNPVIISMAIGLTIGMVLAGLTTVLPAPVPGTPNAIIIGQPPSAKEKLLDYGIPAWIASVVSGLVVGWLWRVYPLRIQIKFVLEDEKNK